jgi:enoyl-CoA hydratase
MVWRAGAAFRAGREVSVGIGRRTKEASRMTVAGSQDGAGADPEDVVLIDVSESIATVTLNRPHARNALNHAVRSRLPAVMERLDADDRVDAIILTGTDPAFCAGLDLKELGSGGHDYLSPIDPVGRQSPFGDIGKPVMGAVNGAAVTGGLELALHCDFIVASDRAVFADTHCRVGVQPWWGLTVLLPQAIGLRRAKQMSITGNYLDAATAADWGLVNRVVSHEILLPACRALARDVASSDRAAVARMLRTYDEGSETSAAHAWQIEAEAAAEWLRSGRGRPAEVERRRALILQRGRDQNR